MTWLRHSSRHVFATVFNHVETELTTLGWTVAGSTPFGAPVVELVDKPLVDGDQVRQEARAGKVFVMMGTEVPPEGQEVGGPLSMQAIPIFFDVFMDANAHAVALATDIRDILMGRIGGKRWLNVINQATGNPEPGWAMELCDVERVSPEQRFSLHWQSLRMTAEVHFQEEVW